MKKDSHNLGTLGEGLAVKHLKKSGYQILETNWRFKKLEIDVIAQKDNMMVFVEVKARTSDLFGGPEEFVTKQKQKFMIAAAHQYIIERDIILELRFDIIAILNKDTKFEINHIEGAFYPVAQ